MSQIIPVTGSLTKRGAGTLSLAAGSTYAGGTAVYGGTVIVTEDSALGASGKPIILDGGVLRFTTSGDTTVGRTIRIGGGGATLGAASGLVRCYTAISNMPGQSAALRIEAGGGTVLLGGANVYTGGTIVDATHVAIQGNRAFGDGTLTLNGGRVRTTSTSGNPTFVSNNVILAADSILGSTASANTLYFLGPVVISNGTRTLTVEGNHLSVFEGAVGDGGNGYGFVKDGAQTLIMGGVNTYSGITRVKAGTLALTNDASLASGILQIDYGAVLDVTGKTGGSMTLASGQTLKGTGAFAGGLIAGSGSAIAPGSSPGTLEIIGDLTFDATMTLKFDLKDNVNAESDYLNVIGDLKKGGGFTSVLFDFLGSGQVGTYALIGFQNSELGTGDFGFSNLKAGLSVDPGSVSLASNELTLTVIPEPASLGTLGLLALGALLRRRQRR